MSTGRQRQVLTGVERLQFGPASDVFSQALRIALSYMGETVEYVGSSAGSGATVTCSTLRRTTPGSTS
ncbi:MAG: hypothetical protein CME04_17170 [Gemmatimonadaceae bacterium]|nr:hypothetical protein [Gemmatimonadaceae bacterium]